MKTLTRDDTQHGCEYYDAAEVESELVVMIALRLAAEKALATLTDLRIGTWTYMEGSQVYEEFREVAAVLQAALSNATGVSK